MPGLTGNSLKLLIILSAALLSCRQVDIPKPKGHFRIDLPQKEYTHFANNAFMPFSFEYPVYGNISFRNDNPGETGWFNIEFPGHKAKIYLTYREIKNDFADLMEQTYKMNVKNHILKADAINEQAFINEDSRVFGILYELKGNTATAVQFYATDSIRNYLRGSLYFSAQPDADSLAPVIEFFREDIIHLIETLKWNK